MEFVDHIRKQASLRSVRFAAFSDELQKIAAGKDPRKAGTALTSLASLMGGKGVAAKTTMRGDKVIPGLAKEQKNFRSAQGANRALQGARSILHP